MDLVVVGDFYVVSVSAFPSKANPPLVIDANAELSVPISSQGFQTIRRGIKQFVDSDNRMKHAQLVKRPALNFWR
jgi:hypothetical protein